MSKPKCIVILGNSVSLRMRPPRASSSERTFAELLRDEGYDVINRSQAGIMINESFSQIDDTVVASSPDFVLINFGIVELFPRRTFRWLNNLPIRNYYNNNAFSRNFFFEDYKWIFFPIHGLNWLSRIISKHTGSSWHWLSSNRYHTTLHSMCKIILKETYAKIGIIGVLQQQNIDNSNLVIHPSDVINNIGKNIAKEFSSRVFFIDLDGKASGRSINELMPDGIHFSACGHRVLYNAVSSTLNTWRQHD